MPQVLNNRQLKWKLPDNAVYVGRPSKWGNPFHTKETLYGKPSKLYTRDEAISLYELYITNNEELLSQLHELKGKDLVCWCAPYPCHADILLRLANDD